MVPNRDYIIWYKTFQAFRVNMELTCKAMLKILQARLQQYVNCELPDVQAGFRKGRGTREKIANIHWVIKKPREFQKTSISALLTIPKPLSVWITTNCGKFWRDGNTRPLDLPLGNLCAGQETTVRTRYGTTHWFQIGKAVQQGCILSSCLFNLYTEYFMRNAGMDEAQS